MRNLVKENASPTFRSSLSKMATAEVIWSVTQKSNCFRIKRNGLDLSKEPVNAAGKHAYACSGFVQPSIGVVPTKSGKLAAVVNSKYSNKPNKAVHSVGVSKNLVKGTKSVNKVAWKIAGRPDQRNAALAKATALAKARASASAEYKFRVHPRRA